MSNNSNSEVPLEHKILGVLVDSAMVIVQTGSEKEGMTPIEKLISKTGRVHFGTLIGLLNEPGKFKAYQENLKPVILKTNDVTIIDYDWSEVRKSIHILEMNGHVEDTAEKANLTGGLMTELLRLHQKGCRLLHQMVYKGT